VGEWIVQCISRKGVGNIGEGEEKRRDQQQNPDFLI
jgi:hypothetical protein